LKKTTHSVIFSGLHCTDMTNSPAMHFRIQSTSVVFAAQLFIAPQHIAVE